MVAGLYPRRTVHRLCTVAGRGRIRSASLYYRVAGNAAQEAARPVEARHHLLLGQGSPALLPCRDVQQWLYQTGIRIFTARWQRAETTRQEGAIHCPEGMRRFAVYRFPTGLSRLGSGEPDDAVGGP